MIISVVAPVAVEALLALQTLFINISGEPSHVLKNAHDGYIFIKTT
jgi:hypothetical protein